MLSSSISVGGHNLKTELSLLSWCCSWQRCWLSLSLSQSLKGPSSLNRVKEDEGASVCLCCKQLTWKPAWRGPRYIQHLCADVCAAMDTKKRGKKVDVRRHIDSLTLMFSTPAEAARCNNMTGFFNGIPRLENNKLFSHWRFTAMASCIQITLQHQSISASQARLFQVWGADVFPQISVCTHLTARLMTSEKKNPLQANDRRAILQLSLITGFSERRFIVTANSKLQMILRVFLDCNHPFDAG